VLRTDCRHQIVANYWDRRSPR